ncbi:hypothetical protein GCM10011348_19550 [Marinobacterium nitratireducens]|uniref:Polymer-forming cytoskeletal protein n=1 Tax=Marinobacterium nitratireducens TaxID=518897 RepID=A0A917ZCZ4_9GAMM|nr:polymer-forming cytoskeletal protein [Marinobacterium nitratireducens]GGO81153.1 hypothetical protein GCM10011348_19550 [Marinobacterium nitratireducens]
MGILKKKSAANPPRGAVTIIAHGNRVSGDLRIQGRLHVDGAVEGKIDSSDDISIGRKGWIKGHVRARELHVSGQLEGEVVCDALHVEAGGKVRARVLSQTLAVDPRGCFQGERRSPAPEPLVLETMPEPDTGAEPEQAPRRAATMEFGVDAIDSLPDRITLSRDPGKA